MEYATRSVSINNPLGLNYLLNRTYHNPKKWFSKSVSENNQSIMNIQTGNTAVKKITREILYAILSIGSNNFPQRNSIFTR